MSVETEEKTASENKQTEKDIRDSIKETGYYTVPTDTTCFLIVKFKDSESPKSTKYYPMFTTRKEILVGESIKGEDSNSIPNYPLTTENINDKEEILEYALQHISLCKTNIPQIINDIQKDKEVCYKEFIENTESLQDLDPTTIADISFNIPTED